MKKRGAAMRKLYLYCNNEEIKRKFRKYSFVPETHDIKSCTDIFIIGKIKPEKEHELKQEGAGKTFHYLSEDLLPSGYEELILCK